MIGRACTRRGRHRYREGHAVSQSIVHVTDEGFAEAVLASDLPVVLDFWAPWCGPCRMMEPVLEEIAAEYAGRLVVAKLNVDESPKTATEYDILSIPTLMMFKGGKIVKTLVGAMPKKKIVEELAGVLG
jgi:thioredoxin 1